MEIKTVSIVGLGALGVLFGNHLSKHMNRENLRIVADSNRIEKYIHEGVFCNGVPCDFNYVSSDAACTPSDLLIFSVKSNSLEAAISTAKNQVGPNTLIISLLNGISSEEIIGQTFGMEKIIYSVAQGMDAVKIENKLNYQQMGMICFGDMKNDLTSEKVLVLDDFLNKMFVPHEVSPNMHKKLWGKFMMNVGVNQSVAVFECDYGGVQRDGIARETMIAAMREVITLSEKEDVFLTEDDLNYWLRVLEGLNPQGKPSMRQDIEAKRYSEVNLFAGTVLTLGRKHEIDFPVNQMLYNKIKALENDF